jgi:hypothetical protein
LKNEELIKTYGFGNLLITTNYLITADIARGDGTDYSTFHIIDIETFTQVGEYRGQIGTKILVIY